MISIVTAAMAIVQKLVVKHGPHCNVRCIHQVAVLCQYLEDHSAFLQKVLATLFAVHSKITTQVQLDYVIKTFLFQDLQFRCGPGLDLKITPNQT
jgi:hypothetical protein